MDEIDYEYESECWDESPPLQDHCSNNTQVQEALKVAIKEMENHDTTNQ